MILTLAKTGRREGLWLFREAETNSGAVVWEWGANWGQIIQGLESWRQGVWTSMGGRWKSWDSVPRPRPLCDFSFSPETGSSLLTREPSSGQRVSYALVAAVSFGFALGVLYLLSTHKDIPEKNMKTRVPFTQLYQVLTSSCFWDLLKSK